MGKNRSSKRGGSNNSGSNKGNSSHHSNTSASGEGGSTDQQQQKHNQKQSKQQQKLSRRLSSSKSSSSQLQQLSPPQSPGNSTTKSGGGGDNRDVTGTTNPVNPDVLTSSGNTISSSLSSPSSNPTSTSLLSTTSEKKQQMTETDNQRKVSSSDSNNNVTTDRNMNTSVTNKQQQRSGEGDNTTTNNSSSNYLKNKNNTKISIIKDWINKEKDGITWVICCAIIGCIIGFGIGTGILTGTGIITRNFSYTEFPFITFQFHKNNVSPWRNTLGIKIRSTTMYQLLTLQQLQTQQSPSTSSSPSGRWLNNNNNGNVFSSSKMSFKSLQFWSMNKNNNDDDNFHPLLGSHENNDNWRNNPSHPITFAMLRESIIREPGGYVHPDLGILSPAPSGTSRGIGMISNKYTSCQRSCMPGVASEKLNYVLKSKTTTMNNYNNNNTSSNNNSTTTGHNHDNSDVLYKQEEVLLRIPLSIQMTRKVALDTLIPMIPLDVQRRAPLEELDDAALLVLLLANERGVGRSSRFFPYIQSLPLEPTCGYSHKMRPYMLDSIKMMGEQLNMDVNGWPTELTKATQYADKIVTNLNRDYGQYIKSRGTGSFNNIQWSLCQVASRATAGSESYGTLRLIPMIDMINHDVNAGKFIELTGNEQIINGDVVDSAILYNDGDFCPQKDSINYVQGSQDSNTNNNNQRKTTTTNEHEQSHSSSSSSQTEKSCNEENSKSIDNVGAGAFIVRSTRHGRRKPLRKGQELLVNYNIPGYSPLDWFISLGFVPPERWGRWTKIDSALPRVRSDAATASSSSKMSSSTPASSSGSSGSGSGTSSSQN